MLKFPLMNQVKIDVKIYMSFQKKLKKELIKNQININYKKIKNNLLLNQILKKKN